MGTKRYPDAEIGTGGRPAPGERAEDYRMIGIHSAQHREMCIDSKTVTVSREGDNHPDEKWLFDATQTGEVVSPGKFELEVAPKAVKFKRLEDRNGTPTVDTGRGRSNRATRRESVSLDDVPESVRAALDAKDGVRVVETLG